MGNFLTRTRSTVVSYNDHTIHRVTNIEFIHDIEVSIPRGQELNIAEIASKLEFDDVFIRENIEDILNRLKRNNKKYNYISFVTFIIIYYKRVPMIRIHNTMADTNLKEIEHDKHEYLCNINYMKSNI